MVPPSFLLQCQHYPRQHPRQKCGVSGKEPVDHGSELCSALANGEHGPQGLMDSACGHGEVP